MTVDTPSTESRPLNPLAAMTLVLVFPGRTFRRLVDRPHWALPLIFVIAAVMANRFLALGSGVMDEMLRSEAFLSGAGLTEARSAALVFAVVSSIVAVPIVTLLQALFFKIAGDLFRGSSRFRVVFSAVCHASIPMGLSALAFAALMPLTHSPNAAANLAFLVDPVAHPFLWCLAMELDLSALWFFVLLGIAAEPVFSLPRRKARLATLVFAIVYILVMSWTGRGSAVRTVDPYAGWSSQSTASAVLHFSDDAPATTIAEAALACERALDRVEALAGVRPAERIDCYLYPSLEEKRRVTDNPGMAHRVEWADAVHLAWETGSEAALTREILKLADANAHGKVYNPLVRDGLAVYAGSTWAGMSVRDAGRDLRERHALPDLGLLVDAVTFRQIDERVSQPAAASFVAFLTEEVGADGVRDLYLDSARRPADVQQIIEAALSDSLGAVGDRWVAYLEAETDESGARAPVD